ncbi:MAG: ATP-binding protein [Gammaproteobacteria bacterium]|jgi:serine/threonine-protein kinase RsbW
MGVEQLQLLNKPEELIRLKEWLNRICDSHEISDKTRFSLELVLEEAVTNVFDYAFDKTEEHQFSLELNLSESDISVILQDNGIAFNPLQQQEPVQANSIEDAKIGGMGIHLIKSYTKLVDYFRKEGTNNLLMVLDR